MTNFRYQPIINILLYRSSGYNLLDLDTSAQSDNYRTYRPRRGPWTGSPQESYIDDGVVPIISHSFVNENAKTVVG